MYVCMYYSHIAQLSVCYYSKTSKSSGAEGNGMSYEEKLKLLQSIDEEEEGVANYNYIVIDSHLMTLDNVQNIIINVPITLPPPFSHPSLLLPLSHTPLFSPPPFFLISPSLSLLSPLFLSPSLSLCPYSNSRSRQYWCQATIAQFREAGTQESGDESQVPRPTREIHGL